MNATFRRTCAALPVAAIWTVLLALAPMGCTRHTDFNAFLPEPRPVVTSTTYRMMPPDMVLITSKTVRELNGHTEQISPDGRLTLPLLGGVYVANRTAEDLAAELRTRYAEYYKDADVNVRVVGYNSKKIFVWGEVGTPGPYPYNGANTILETLARAQPTRLADPGRIHILRPNKDGQLIKRMTIDLNDMVKDGDVALNAVLEQNDIIYVPANALATVGLALQQLLLPIQPAAATVQAPRSFDTTFRSRPYGTDDSTTGN